MVLSTRQRSADSESPGSTAGGTRTRRRARPLRSIPMSTWRTAPYGTGVSSLLSVRLCRALAMLASERFLVLKRVEKLDRMVGMHLSVRRLLEHERERQAEVAIETLADLTAKMETPGLSASERSRLSARFDAISRKFSLDASSTSVIAGVKRRVQSHGLKLPSSDRVWATHAHCEVVAKLAAVTAHTAVVKQKLQKCGKDRAALASRSTL